MERTRTTGRLWRRRPSPAMVVACLALTVALSGASYAAVVLPRNSVGTPQLKKNAVVAAKVKKNAITGAKVKKRSLQGVDFALGQLPAGSPGPAGPAGPQGSEGQQGTQGPPGLSLWAVVASDGTLIRGSGVTASTKSGFLYSVTFNQDVGNCAFAGTVRFGSGGVILIVREPNPLSGPNIVGVEARDATSPATTVDATFYLIAAC